MAKIINTTESIDSHKKPLKHEIGNLNDLQRVLCDQIQNVIDGTATPQSVNAITNAAGKVISISKLRLEVAKAAGKAFEAEELTKIQPRALLPKPKIFKEKVA